MTYLFYDLKIQFSELILDLPVESKRARQLADWIVHRLADWKSGACAITDAGFAERFDCSTDTVARAVKKLRDSGYFDIKRGRTGRATTYAFKPHIWDRAIKMREQKATKAKGEKGKNADCGPTDLPTQTPQNCRPILKESKNKIGTQDCGEPDADRDGWLGRFPPNSFQVRQFQTSLQQLGLGIPLEQLPSDDVDGMRRYQMPRYSLPKIGSASRKDFEAKLEGWLKELGLWPNGSA